jgi:NAD(P)-dependent dehydrogenase (short-subunit alcohol dehydrogenase family)
MDKLNNNRTVMITGAGGNLGKVVIESFVERGYRVIAIVHRSANDLNLPPENIFTVDLSDENATIELVEKLIRKFEKIDAGLMLAGGFAAGDIAATTSTEIKKMITLNFETAYNLTKAILPHMKMHNYGRLIFMGAKPAISAPQGKNMVAYALSKSLLFRLAEFINADAKGKNINATVLVPGTIDTKDNREAMPESDPSKWVKPSDFAAIMDFILSKPANALKDTVLKVYGDS